MVEQLESDWVNVPVSGIIVLTPVPISQTVEVAALFFNQFNPLVAVEEMVNVNAVSALSVTSLTAFLSVALRVAPVVVPLVKTRPFSRALVLPKFEILFEKPVAAIANCDAAEPITASAAVSTVVFVPRATDIANRMPDVLADDNEAFVREAPAKVQVAPESVLAATAKVAVEAATVTLAAEAIVVVTVEGLTHVTDILEAVENEALDKVIVTESPD